MILLSSRESPSLDSGQGCELIITKGVAEMILWLLSYVNKDNAASSLFTRTQAALSHQERRLAVLRPPCSRSFWEATEALQSVVLVLQFSQPRRQTYRKQKSKKYNSWTSLVAQWLRVCLPTQGTQVRALVQEDPTCHRATKPMRHNSWACALEPTSHNCWAHMPQLLKPMRLEPVLCNKRSHCNEKPVHHHEV